MDKHDFLPVFIDHLRGRGVAAADISRYIEYCEKLQTGLLAPPCPVCFVESHSSHELIVIGSGNGFWHFRCHHCRQSFTIGQQRKG